MLQLRIVLRLSFFLSLFYASSSWGIISKTDALDLLKREGIRWRQTEFIAEDAEQTHIQAQAGLMPHLDVVGREVATRTNLQKYGFEDPGPMQIVTFGGIFLEGEYALLDRKSMFREQAAKTNVDLQKQNQIQYQGDLTFAMLLTYLNCQRLTERVNVYDKSIERNIQIESMAKSRLSAGVGIQTDLMRARGIVGLDNLKRIDAQAELSKCRKDLANALGLPFIKDELEPLQYESFFIDTADPFMKTGIEDRPDIKATILSIEAAKQLKQQSQAETFPVIQLLGEVGFGGSNIVAGAGTTALGAIGIQIKFPFSEGKYFQSKVKQASINVSRAELQAKQIRIEAEGQIQSAIEKLKTTKTAGDLAEEQVHLAKEELKIIQSRFRSGASNGPDLATAQNNLSNVLLNQIEVIFANEAAKINYYRSISEIESYIKPTAQK